MDQALTDSDEPPAHDRVEAAIPVITAPAGEVSSRELHRTQMACTLAERREVGAAYLRVFEWIKRNGFVCTGEVREQLLGASPLEVVECPLIEIQVAIEIN